MQVHGLRKFGALADASHGPPERKPTLYGPTLSALVRIDQVLFAGRAFGVDSDVVELQRLLQRYHLRVVTGKGGFELGDDPLAQLRTLGRSDILQEWKQKPAAHAPGHAECPVQLDRTRVETAIDIDLLVHARSVAAVDFCGLVGRNLHAGENLAGE